MFHGYIAVLSINRRDEEEAWDNQIRVNKRLDNWGEIISKYEDLDHPDRQTYIVERLSNFRFSSINGDIERTVGKKAISKMSEYYENNDIEKAQIWKKILVIYCSILEYVFFFSSEKLKSVNPVKRSEMTDISLGELDKFDWTLLRVSAVLFRKKVASDDLKTCMNKFIETLDVLQNATDDIGRIIEENTSDVRRHYQAHNLGLVKWSSKIMD